LAPGTKLSKKQVKSKNKEELNTTKNNNKLFDFFCNKITVCLSCKTILTSQVRKEGVFRKVT